jgi:hypothetical protein
MLSPVYFRDMEYVPGVRTGVRTPPGPEPEYILHPELEYILHQRSCSSDHSRDPSAVDIHIRPYNRRFQQPRWRNTLLMHDSCISFPEKSYCSDLPGVAAVALHA